MEGHMISISAKQIKTIDRIARIVDESEKRAGRIYNEIHDNRMSLFFKNAHSVCVRVEASLRRVT
jgi:hypothetical protein